MTKKNKYTVTKIWRKKIEIVNNRRALNGRSTERPVTIGKRLKYQVFLAIIIVLSFQTHTNNQSNTTILKGTVA
jgi:hypothetical protein